jgi:hypothetical protein
MNRPCIPSSGSLLLGAGMLAGAAAYRARCSALKYNKDQWISSFEDEMLRLRPHMSSRVLTTVGLAAWNKRGTKDEDPHQAAREWSKSMDS